MGNASSCPKIVSSEHVNIDAEYVLQHIHRECSLVLCMIHNSQYYLSASIY